MSMLSGLMAGGFGEYFSPEGMTLLEIARRVKSGDKPYDREVLFPVEELWAIRDYSWSRSNLRQGAVPVGPPKTNGCPTEYSHEFSGTARWDALVAWMKQYGWRCDPAHVFVGRDGRVKLGEGNHRVAIARQLGIKKAPVIFWHRTEVSKTSEQALPPRQLAGLKRSVPASALDYAATKLAAKMKRCGVTKAQLREGMKVELEHRDVTHGAIEKTARIALAHLCERKDYYKLLKRYVER